jgi:hypothetical protein
MRLADNRQGVGLEACAHLRRTHPSARPISVLECAESPAQSLRRATRIQATTHGYAEVCRKTEGRLAAGPRLLIRMSLVRAARGADYFGTSATSPPRSRRALALKLRRSPVRSILARRSRARRRSGALFHDRSGQSAVNTQVLQLNAIRLPESPSHERSSGSDHRLPLLLETSMESIMNAA